MLQRPLVKLLKLTKYGSALSMQLVWLTRKHPEKIHPKHLVQVEEPWYLEYVRPRDVVLDIGCGNGIHTLKCARRCKRVVGFDYDEKQLRIARRVASRSRIKNVSFFTYSAEKELPFEKAAFDVVLLLDVFEHINNRSLLLKEAKRVLKSKGRLLISVPNKDTSWKKLQMKAGLLYYSDPDHKIEFSANEIKGSLEERGFAVEFMGPIVYDTPLAGLIDLIGGISLGAYRRLLKWKRDYVREKPEESIGFRIVAKAL